MQKLHQKLIQKYQTYNTWHQTKHHNKIHWGALVVFTFLIFGTISLWTPISLAADIAAPTTPTGLTVAAISSSQINLSWTISTDDVGVTGYKIYRCAGSACAPTVLIATSATNSYSDTGLTASTAYTYAVSAYDAANNESAKSTSASATTLSTTQTWQQTLGQNFDIADTFDHYNDWKPVGTSCGDMAVNGGPVYTSGGSLGLWETYALQTNAPEFERQNAVGAHDADKRVGIKSMMLGPEGNIWGYNCQGNYVNPNYAGHQGVSWFKGYFGEEGNQDGSSGYDEVYIFFRAYIPKNYIPTNEENLADKIFKYIEGNDYLDTSGVGAKMVNIGTGFVDTLKYHNADTNTIVDFNKCPIGYDCRYGDSETWLYMTSRKDREGRRRNLATTVTYLNAYGGVGDKNYPYSDGWKNVIDQLGAVEIHMKLESPQYAGAGPKNGDGVIQVFVYDQYGNSMETVYGNNLVFRSNANQANHKINRIFFHGNHRTRNESGTGDYYYGCGEGMECAWWIDDFIVDNQRVGPKYFSLLTGTTPPTDTTSPSTPTNLTAAPVSSSQINLSWTASTDDVGVAGYKIYRCLGSACAPTTQISTSAVNSYSNTGLTASTAYTYAVSAYDAAGNESGKSSSVSAATLAQFKQADFNKDGVVNQLDFDILKQDWSKTDKPVSDLNQDGIVDSRDLGIMMGEWGG